MSTPSLKRPSSMRRLDELERVLERGDARPRPVEAALGARDVLQQVRRTARIGIGSEQVQRRLRQRELAARMAERPRGGGRAAEERHAVGAGALLRVRHAVPQLEGSLEQRSRLAVRVHALGGRRSAHRPLECLRLIAGRGEVVRDRRDERGRGLLVDARLERLSERQMQRSALARQQVVVDDLAQQRVPEAVPAVLGRDEDVAVDRLAQCVAQRPLVEPAGLGQNLVAEPLADGDEPQDLLRRLR
jgi:hypothetical protein